MQLMFSLIIGVFALNVVIARILPPQPSASASVFKDFQRSWNIFDQITDPSVYDPRLPPNTEGPIEVKTSVSVKILSGIQSQSSEFSSQLVIQHIWTDPRLFYSDYDSNPTSLKGEQAFSEKIWKPSIYVINEKDSSQINVPQENVLVIIAPNGTVTYSYRVRSRVYCALNLMKFPFDQQLCSIYFESWSNTVDEQVLVWNEEGAYISSYFPMLEYSLVKYYKQTQVNIRSEGAYSCLVLQFLLERESGFYILDFYVPAMFLVILSWVSFWLEAGAVPARVTLGSSSMLTFITLSRNLSAALPKVSYIKAMDVYALICMFFIFASLIEFAFVNSIWRRSREMELKKLSTTHVIRRALTPSVSRRVSVSAYSENSKSDGYYEDLNQLTIPMDSQTSNRHRERSFTSQLRLSVNEILNQRTARFPDSESCPDLVVTGFDNSASEDKYESITIAVPPQGSKKAKRVATKMNPHEIAKYIDRRSRIFFPLCFLIVNVLYWSLVWI